MELDELAGRLDRLEKAHAVTALVLKELTWLLCIKGVVDEYEPELFVAKVSKYMTDPTPEALEEMQAETAKFVTAATGLHPDDWRHVLDRAFSGEAESKIGCGIPPMSMG